MSEVDDPLASDRFPTEVDLAALRRQLGEAARAVRRPQLWLGIAREVAHVGLNSVSYPLGVRQAQIVRETPLQESTLHARTLLADDEELAATPVVLVHGYLHNHSAFRAMTRQLRQAGFRWVHGLNYNPLAEDIPRLAARLAVEVDRVLTASRAERCMIVGHSMGGIVARYYVQKLARPEVVDTVITLGSPHRGSYTSYLGLGPATTQLRPGSLLLRELEASARPTSTRWVAFYSDLELFVTPAVSAKLVHPALRATNIRVRDTGHLSLLLSGEVMREVLATLGDRDRHRPDPPDIAALPPSRTRPGRRRREPPAADPRAATPGAPR